MYMHNQAIHFMTFVKYIFPEHFIEKKILDVGSGDINGNNRYLFTDCDYNGNDVFDSSNVTIVSRTKDLPFEDESFDTIVSTECFEHDPEYEKSLQKMYKLLKPNGIIAFTCASTDRPEHGTRKTSPQDSLGTINNIEDMQDYYKNLDEYDIENVFKNYDITYDTYYNYISKDLYFIGVKDNKKIPEYRANYVIKNYI